MKQPVVVYGIPNCDTVKKALNWLKENKIPWEFHDYKQKGISREKLTEWIDKAGWENIFNKKSTSWRELPAARQARVVDAGSAITVMLENNSIIKRPVIEAGKKLLVGFSVAHYEQIFH
ncbi:MAG: ArsC family reductase [Ferruginibacter sp.]